MLFLSMSPADSEPRRLTLVLLETRKRRKRKKEKKRNNVTLKQMLYVFAPLEFSVYSNSIEMFKLNWNL
jgi:hypothetical protein